MMKKKEHFNKIEEKILRVLYQKKIQMTIYEVARASGVSYPTAKKYLYKLVKEKYLTLRMGRWAKQK